MRFLNVANANLSGFFTLWALHNAVNTYNIHWVPGQYYTYSSKCVVYLDGRQSRIDHCTLRAYGEWLVKDKQHGISFRSSGGHLLFSCATRGHWRRRGGGFFAGRSEWFFARRRGFGVFLRTTIRERFRGWRRCHTRAAILLHNGFFVSVGRFFYFLCDDRWFSARQLRFFEFFWRRYFCRLLIAVIVFLIDWCICDNISRFQRFDAFLKQEMLEKNIFFSSFTHQVRDTF